MNLNSHFLINMWDCITLSQPFSKLKKKKKIVVNRGDFETWERGMIFFKGVYKRESL